MVEIPKEINPSFYKPFKITVTITSLRNKKAKATNKKIAMTSQPYLPSPNSIPMTSSSTRNIITTNSIA